MPFGASQFAIARGNAFEAKVTANGGAELLSLLRERLGLPLPEVSYDDLSSAAGHETLEMRYRRTRQLLLGSARSEDDAGTLFDHPMLRMDIGGRYAYLEPDLIAFKLGNLFRVVEIKSFPVIDRHADPRKVAAAAGQSAVYVMAVRQLLQENGENPDMVSHEVVLVCPRDFSNQPTLALVDVRKQMTVLSRQLQRLADLGELVATLPPNLTLHLGSEAEPRSVGELMDVLAHLEARYAPECLSTCELGFLCREQADGSTAALGRTVREDLGGVDTIASALSLARGTMQPGEQEIESARLLQTAARLRRECLGGAA